MKSRTYQRIESPTAFQKLVGLAIYFEGSKSALAKKLGCSRTTIHHWISGRTSPPFAKLAELSRVSFHAPSEPVVFVPKDKQ